MRTWGQSQDSTSVYKVTFLFCSTNRDVRKVHKPGTKQPWAINPSFNSAKQMMLSPVFQFQLGIFGRKTCFTVESSRNRLVDTEDKLVVTSEDRERGRGKTGEGD